MKRVVGGALGLVLMAATAAAQLPPRDPIPPAQKNAARIAQLQEEAKAYNRAGEFEKTVAALEEIARLDPTSAEARHTPAAYYWEKAYRDIRLSPDQKREYLEKGIALEDAALALNPEYLDALTYKNLLLRLKANIEPDPQQRQQLLAEADALRARAIELGKQRGRVAGTEPQPGVPPPPPPPPPPGTESAMQPVRVGGNIPAPVKVRDVKPVYPPEAQAARISGVVICEIVVGTDGTVTDAQVLRSIPQLDAAALDAVQLWKFTPTLLNGVPVPVIMTVTVSFTLQ